MAVSTKLIRLLQGWSASTPGGCVIGQSRVPMIWYLPCTYNAPGYCPGFCAWALPWREIVFPCHVHVSLVRAMYCASLFRACAFCAGCVCATLRNCMYAWWWRGIALLVFVYVHFVLSGFGLQSGFACAPGTVHAYYGILWYLGTVAEAVPLEVCQGTGHSAVESRREAARCFCVTEMMIWCWNWRLDIQHTHRYKSQSTLMSRRRSGPRTTGQSSDPQRGGGGGEGVASAIEHSSDGTQQSSSSAYCLLYTSPSPRD